MNTGQIMITLLALILLSLLTLRVNSSQLSTQDIMQNDKFGMLTVHIHLMILMTLMGIR